MKFIPSDQYPRAFHVTEAAASLVCQVTYVGHGNAHTGHAMDGQVLPLILAAPDLLDSLQNLVRCIERDNLHTTHGVKLASARAAIAKASPRP